MGNVTKCLRLIVLKKQALCISRVNSQWEKSCSDRVCWNGYSGNSIESQVRFECWSVPMSSGRCLEAGHFQRNAKEGLLRTLLALQRAEQKSSKVDFDLHSIIQRDENSKANGGQTVNIHIRAVRRQKKGASYRRLRRLLRRLYIVNPVLEASGRQALLL